MQMNIGRRRRSIVQAGAALWVFSPALLAQGRPARYPMSSDVVAQALKANGLEVKPSEVYLPMMLSSAAPSPAIEITATERLADGRVRLQLRCRKAGECVPFNATLDIQSSAAVAAEAGAQSGSSEGATTGKPMNVESIGGSEPGGASHGVIANETSVLRAGSRVMLVLRDDHMTIHMPVIALDSGAPGAEVRVSRADRRKMFHATVVDKTTVTAVVN
jgi:hypothetical protein